MAVTIKMQSRGVLTLPKKMRTRLGLETGSLMRVREKDGGIFVSPTSLLDPELLADVRAALADARAGRLTPAFGSGKELDAYVRTVKKKVRRT